MKIYDVFPFFNELDLLEIRLEYLYESVDFFVITEAPFTHSGLPKRFILEDNMDRFSRFADKIILHKAGVAPSGLNTFQRDWFQRDSVKPFLDSRLTDQDILIYGDVDEIPNLFGLTQAINLLQSGRQFCHFSQRVFYYYLNLEEVSGKLLSTMGEFPGIKQKSWLGTTASRWSYSKKFSPTHLRDAEHVFNSVRIKDGGWHFSYCGGETLSNAEERVAVKMTNSAHQELNTFRNRALRKIRLSMKRDLFGRRGTKFSAIKNLDFLPPVVRDNTAKYDYLLLKPFHVGSSPSDLAS